ncbi:FAD/NAD P-binding domain-containing protein [Gloeophyllum trabeum ATCC 11539]|uniref:FAD/NAD P-binding domain-containing protein n=1 Tax=Gloeophyllum trabeum (strain ATCC 11539 / FP-39264 / Madison 617) TaxID=670483 RepID=S7RJP4_GLOTA|nr:FAD/NAD P-binding domain-containing protein [Gloeophyllum trabeum ATCC 11539]EPQ52859.1 FAD/NAD P-binding domain-containing protein [Gloeophyllum trabeum ATCC 11539]
MEAKFRVAIIGGGIAGLTLAYALAKSPNIEIHVYEAAHQFSEIGAGIGMYSRVWKILNALGLHRDLAALTHIPESALEGRVDETKMHHFLLRKSDQAEGVNYHVAYGRGVSLLFHRAHFQQAILKNVPPSVKTHLSKRLASLDEPSNKDDPIVLYFTDGSTATCDVAFGADGIKSAVRAAVWKKKVDSAAARGHHELAALLTKEMKPMWTGTVAYRALVSYDIVKEKAPSYKPETLECAILHCGKNKHITVYPVANGKIINIVAFSSKPELEGSDFNGPTVATATKAELLSSFKEFEQPLQDLLACVESPSRWAMELMRPLETYLSEYGRVAILGDAAHAMPPHQGSGAGQSIEDAYILATLLTHPGCTREMLPEALKIYDSIRRPFSQSVLQSSKDVGLMYEFSWPGFTDEDIMRKAADGSMHLDIEALHRLGELAAEVQAWSWRSTIEDDRKQAIEMLEKSVKERGSVA